MYCVFCTGEEEADMLVDLPEDDEIEEVVEDEEEEGEESLFAPQGSQPAAPRVIEPRPQVAAPSTRNTFVTEEETDLLDELRSYLAFGGSINGQATTDELLNRFPNSALPTGMAPLFKCLLQSLAEFYRNSSGVGVWKLKTEFR